MAKELKNREQVDASLKWKLEDIYKDETLVEEDFNKLTQMLPTLGELSGTIKDATSFDNAMKKVMQAQKLGEYLFVYAKMRRDEDNASGKYQAMTDRAQRILVELSTATSFLMPELASKKR
ncbi:hypothetical protein LJB83_01450 [Clostridia bacterium OttesenSCG-928-F22]|nr:hypothetical protein [Clostridia bacterium OttesenSCG-928-F22]